MTLNGEKEGDERKIGNRRRRNQSFCLFRLQSTLKVGKALRAKRMKWHGIRLTRESLKHLIYLSVVFFTRVVIGKTRQAMSPSVRLASIHWIFLLSKGELRGKSVEKSR